MNDANDLGNSAEAGRRTFLATASTGAFLALLGTGSEAATPALSSAEQANVKLVNEFCIAWSTRDMAKILPFLSEDCVYRMTETTPAVTGHAGVTERIKAFLDSSDAVTFEVLESYAKGPMVINHRVDKFASRTRPLTWEGVGVFFIKDGKIREWFDYTISVAR
jgi:limonene-1,2-epoxide hydrolase